MCRCNPVKNIQGAARSTVKTAIDMIHELHYDKNTTVVDGSDGVLCGSVMHCVEEYYVIGRHNAP